MKTAEKNANCVQGTAAKNNQIANRVENRPSLTGKEAAANENVNNQTPAQTSQVEATKLPWLKPVAPLQWITNPLTLHLTPQDRD